MERKETVGPAMVSHPPEREGKNPQKMTYFYTLPTSLDHFRESRPGCLCIPSIGALFDVLSLGVIANFLVNHLFARFSFFGSGSFSVELLEAIAHKSIEEPFGEASTCSSKFRQLLDCSKSGLNSRILVANESLPVLPPNEGDGESRVVGKNEE